MATRSTSKHEISTEASSKHMTLSELEEFCRQARTLGVDGDVAPKIKSNVWAETIKSMKIEYERGAETSAAAVEPRSA
jgi:hypothetical protein